MAAVPDAVPTVWVSVAEKRKMGTNWEAKRKIIPRRRNERVHQTYYVTDMLVMSVKECSFFRFLVLCEVL